MTKQEEIREGVVSELKLYKRALLVDKKGMCDARDFADAILKMLDEKCVRIVTVEHHRPLKVERLVKDA